MLKLQNKQAMNNKLRTYCTNQEEPEEPDAAVNIVEEDQDRQVNKNVEESEAGGGDD